MTVVDQRAFLRLKVSFEKEIIKGELNKHDDCQFIPFFKKIDTENFVYCLKHSGMILFSYLTDFSYFTRSEHIYY